MRPRPGLDTTEATTGAMRPSPMERAMPPEMAVPMQATHSVAIARARAAAISMAMTRATHASEMGKLHRAGHSMETAPGRTDRASRIREPRPPPTERRIADRHLLRKMVSLAVGLVTTLAVPWCLASSSCLVIATLLSPRIAVIDAFPLRFGVNNCRGFAHATNTH